jgi:hypothetical protein
VDGKGQVRIEEISIQLLEILSKNTKTAAPKTAAPDLAAVARAEAGDKGDP